MVASQWELYRNASHGFGTRAEEARARFQQWKEERKEIVKHMEEVWI